MLKEFLDFTRLVAILERKGEKTFFEKEICLKIRKFVLTNNPPYWISSYITSSIDIKVRKIIFFNLTNKK
jgi:hypothetical protein